MFKSLSCCHHLLPSSLPSSDPGPSDRLEASPGQSETAQGLFHLIQHDHLCRPPSTGPPSQEMSTERHHCPASEGRTVLCPCVCPFFCPQVIEDRRHLSFTQCSQPLNQASSNITLFFFQQITSRMNGHFQDNNYWETFEYKLYTIY